MFGYHNCYYTHSNFAGTRKHCDGSAEANPAFSLLRAFRFSFSITVILIRLR